MSLYVVTVVSDQCGESVVSVSIRRYHGEWSVWGVRGRCLSTSSPLKVVSVSASPWWVVSVGGPWSVSLYVVSNTRTLLVQLTVHPWHFKALPTEERLAFLEHKTSRSQTQTLY